MVVGEMQPILDRYKELKGSPELDAILDEGREKAHKKANATYVKAIEAMGLYRK
ncbi:tryptophan--tRNA ligase [Dialister micraerophilus DSM 19965]|uniref:Tryptophan--tRNA ligase n=1 Tax=Dialister micraerophilus DSM 19965 TaxID=888062 RepID=F2BVS1_9FIRM|nr:tryptophan--tRNA ligase [Dialister micraerophilus DSM 19965]EGF15756.1 tryptophan--tRNA ligase [Dialister micraerophilus DSM 19965]